MTSLQAYNLVVKAARNYHNLEMNFSKEEITKKMNEIKYLSAQKKIPRLTLRKEIIHLENKLANLNLLEEKLKQQKEQEQKRTNELKKQISFFKKRLEAASDPEISQKVEKLSYLLGDCLARQEARKDAKTSESLVRIEKENQEPKDKVKQLQEKIAVLKQKIAESKFESSDSLKLAALGKQMEILEQKISGLSEKKEEVKVIKEDQSVKHELLFNLPPPPKTILIESKLPLPSPPQKRRIK